ncbi:MAG: hypothetical protein GOU99_01810, partial [Candidatus Altiarchaeota archaeon]|nr:hypothetical protein [Candidatus Altiarchaeota archaeon]
MPVEKEFYLAIGLMILVFLFLLPPWTDVGSDLLIKSARLENGKLSFAVDYSAPWTKSCYIVAYGPFELDQVGHETGNNIFVLNSRQGQLVDTLTIQQGAELSELRMELW